MQLTKNFWLYEFKCNDENETPVPEVLYPNVQQLADNLQIIRDHLNEVLPDRLGLPISAEISIFISCGYRTPEHNARTKGASKKSYHMKANAGDLKVYYKHKKQKIYIEPQIVFDEIDKLMKEGKIREGGLSKYNTFVHYDTRGFIKYW